MNFYIFLLLCLTENLQVRSYDTQKFQSFCVISIFAPIRLWLSAFWKIDSVSKQISEIFCFANKRGTEDFYDSLNVSEDFERV
ncbi:hypothetical protein A6S26_01895 [Nostoc sp. ATCC 43529]|nr:hypothetical protein A6S26_01895 [Nostoc sp. ATCC 43529]